MRHHPSLPPPSQCTWGLTSTWDVTDCTQAALALIPILVLFIFGSVEIVNLRKRKPRARGGWRGTPLRISVLVAGLLAASVQIALAVRGASVRGLFDVHRYGQASTMLSWSSCSPRR